MPCSRGPLGGLPGAGTPPDPLAQTVGVRLDPEQPGWVGEHRPRVRLGKALALEDLEKDPRVLAGHVGLIGALARDVAEVAVALDDLLGRSTADAELQAPARDEVGRAGVLGHVERVLVAHVDHGGPDLDRAGLGTDGRQQRKRRGKLVGEVVHPEVRPVRTELLGGDREIDRLQQGIRGRAGLRLRRGRPMAERQEPDALHEW